MYCAKFSGKSRTSIILYMDKYIPLIAGIFFCRKQTEAFHIF